MPTTPAVSIPLFQVNTADDPGPGAHASATNAQSNAQVIGLTNGNFLVVWEDGTARTGLEPNDVIGQLYSSTGAKIGAEFIGNANYLDLNQQKHSIAALPGGGFAIAYQTTDATGAANDGENITVEIFDASATYVRTDDFRQGFGGPQGIDDTSPSIAAFSNGSYVAVYEERDTLAGSPVTQLSARVVSSGGAIGSKFSVESSAADVAGASAAVLSNGNFVVGFERPGASGVSFSIYTSAGAPVAELGFAVTSGTAKVAVAALTGGGFVIVWQDANGDGAGNAGIRAAIYSNTGALAKAAFSAAVTTTAGAQTEPAVTALSDGGFVIAWNNEPSNTIRAQPYTAAGTAAGGEVQLASLNNVSDPALGLLSDGRFAVAATNDDAGDLDIEAAIFDARNSSPTAISINTSSVGENAANGTLVGTLSAVDPDGPSATFTIVTGQDAGGRFAIGGANSNQVIVNDGLLLDFEQAASHSIRVRVTDGAGGSFEQNIVIAVSDVNPENVQGDGRANTIHGGVLADVLYGNAGTDTLNGGGGSDQLYGGLGADSHAGGDGYDYARYDDANYGNLRISLTAPGTNTGAAAVGDTYSNIEGVIAGAGNDVVYGNDVANIIDGKAGNDTLFGGLGADSLRGGDGVDYARYDDANYGNLVLSLANAAQNSGTGAAGDLYNSIEGLIAGAGNDRIGGNGYVNYLYGGAGNDIIAGNDGNDTLSSGAGLDTFVFNTPLNAATNRDTILDFVAADDTIQIDRSFFSNTLPLGTLSADRFHAGTAAADAGDRIIYNQSTGALFFDADGTGGAFAAVQFATLSTKPAITNADFVIIA